MSEDLITEEVKAQIGKGPEPVTGDPILARDIRRYALAIEDPNPLYHDENYAKKSKYHGVIAPLGYVVWSAQSYKKNVFPSETREDGIPKEAVLMIMPPVPLQRAVRAGDEFEFFQRIHEGDVITCKMRLAEVYQKEGKTGPMVFSTTESTYTNQKGELVAIQKARYILR